MEHSIDREKVIKGLECCAGQCNYHGCPYKDPCENASGVKQIMLDALALLKEQESTMPTWRQGKAYCGKCGQRLPRKRADREINYCGYCGKAVKWDA